MKHRPELDEYTPNAASAARARDRQRLAREREQAAVREAEQRRIAIEQAREQAEPIADGTELAESVEQLAARWGLKRKARK